MGWQQCVLSRRIYGRIYLLAFPSFQHLPAYLGSGLHTIGSVIKSSLALTLLFSSSKDLRDYIGPTRIIRDNFPILRLDHICKVLFAVENKRYTGLGDQDTYGVPSGLLSHSRWEILGYSKENILVKRKKMTTPEKEDAIVKSLRHERKQHPNMFIPFQQYLAHFRGLVSVCKYMLL